MAADIPTIVWEEHFTLEDGAQVADAIFAVFDSNLTALSPGEHRWFFFVPTPAPYDVAEREFLAAVASDDNHNVQQDFRLLTLERAGKCYATQSPRRFRALLPQAFLLGPPELTFIAANSKLDLTAPSAQLAEFALTLLRRQAAAAERRDAVGLHFDSGDLVELF